MCVLAVPFLLVIGMIKAIDFFFIESLSALFCQQSRTAPLVFGKTR